MASLAFTRMRGVPPRGIATLSNASATAARRGSRVSQARFASTSSRSTLASNSMLRGVLAGMGLSLATVLIAYRTGAITIRAEAGTSNDAASAGGQYGSHEDVQKAISELHAAFSDPHAVSTDRIALKNYGSSPNSYHPESPHSVVVHVQSTEDVVKVVNIARKYRVPVVAYSGATSLEGHFSGVCLRRRR